MAVVLDITHQISGSKMIYKKSIHLKDWLINRDVRNFIPPKDIEIAYQEIDKNNKECYATLTGHNRKLLDMTAAQMPILSERARTLKSIPKYRKSNITMERII